MPARKDRLQRLEKELADARGAVGGAHRALAGREGQARPRGRLKKKLEEARNELAQAQRRGEYQRAGRAHLWRHSRSSRSSSPTIEAARTRGAHGARRR